MSQNVEKDRGVVGTQPSKIAASAEGSQRNVSRATCALSKMGKGSGNRWEKGGGCGVGGSKNARGAGTDPRHRRRGKNP